MTVATPDHSRVRRAVTWLLLWWVSALVTTAALTGTASTGVGYDSHAYWGAWQRGLYDLPPLSRDAYLYSPAFAQLLRPLTLLPWPVFWSLWTFASLLVFCWLLAPLSLRWRLPLLVLCIPEMVTGNIYCWLALTLVLGLRRPGLWAIPLLTKLTPGGIGLLWFAVRREWRNLGVALAVTGAIAGVSFLAAPALWWEWRSFLVHSSSGQVAAHRLSVGATLVILVVGAGLVLVGARTDRPWLLAPALVLLSPTMGVNTLTVLAAIPRLRNHRSAAPSAHRPPPPPARARRPARFPGRRSDPHP